MIVIQDILVRWTKTSRGGAEAARRNAVPEALPLPSPAQDCVCFRHRVVAEEPAFAPIHSLAHAETIDSGCEAVRLQPGARGLEASFTWSYTRCGLPEREDVPARIISRWARVVFNGRFSGDHAWYYQKRVFNIAIVDEPHENLFISSDPEWIISRLADLF